MAAAERGNRDGPGRPHHATVVAWLALFVALGGVASGIPGRNNVGAQNIRDNAVRSPEIAKGKVKRSDIAPEAINTERIADGAVNPLQLGPIPAARVDTPAQDPGCVAQVIEDGSAEPLQFSVEAFDRQGLHNAPPPECAAGTQSRLTAPVSGVYSVAAQVTWPATSGDRSLAIRKVDIGGPTSVARDGAADSEGTGVQTAAGIVDLAAGEYIEVEVGQTSGATMTLSSQLGNHLSMAWIGPLD